MGGIPRAEQCEHGEGKGLVGINGEPLLEYDLKSLKRRPSEMV